MAEEAGIEPARAYSAHIGFEDREGHQTSSHSETACILCEGREYFIDLHHSSYKSSKINYDQ
ncbi:hypothetical protein C9J48_17775 [Photobacterium profundum]|uniref:Uncharacterized protein n=1 Tax=Photobacterium profundum 3TCK TaxID=314280 RepID=Q1Z856_9GAMM|nr:hypothetical protein P3TCK_26827 [Photobacterium profundum 3TCK]PSV60649.1 hypothetical protein C9J48_17775 [Photobacterium profundum]